MTQETDRGRRRLLSGALTASAAAAATLIGGSEAWAQTERLRRDSLRPNRELRLRKRPKLRATRFNFQHSRFRGRALKLRPVSNVNQLISQIAKRTGLSPKQVHQVLAMSYQSTEQFVLRKYAANPDALNKQLKRIGSGSPVAIVSPV